MAAHGCVEWEPAHFHAVYATQHASNTCPASNNVPGMTIASRPQELQLRRRNDLRWRSRLFLINTWQSKTDWDSAKKVLADSSFMDKLKNYDKVSRFTWPSTGVTVPKTRDIATYHHA